LEWLVGRLTARTTLFADTANAAQAETIAGNRGPASRWRCLDSGPQNVVFAPETYLYGLGVGTLSPVDPVAAVRMSG
jgi:hypothetical protein